jgi:ABC-type antimicrobial peptide transport system permease subunit
MAFVEYLIDFFKRAGFFIVGLFVSLFGTVIVSVGASTGNGAMPTVEPNPFSLVIGVIVVIAGIAMMAYAWRSR